MMLIGQTTFDAGQWEKEMMGWEELDADGRSGLERKYEVSSGKIH